MEVKNQKWNEEKLMKELRRVLTLYPTGQEFELEEVLEYHHLIPNYKSIPKIHNEAAETGSILLQPRVGKATIEDMIENLRYLQEREADVLTWTCDTYCRRNLFEKARAALEESKKVGRSLLNGFPSVIHGVKGCQQLFEAVEKPCEGRGATGSPQAYNTFMLGGGATSFNGAALFCGLSVEPRMSVSEVIKNFQYVDRLLGWFEEHGAPVSREAGGFPSGTITPPSISIVSSIIECLLAAEQGVRNLCVAYPLNSCVIQDIAAIQVQKKLCKEYLEKQGYKEIFYTQAAHHWLGPYPNDINQTMARICMDTIICAIARVNKILVKSPEEGKGAPTKEGNAAGLIATRKVLDLMMNQEFPDSRTQEEEVFMIESQCRAIVEKVFEMGDGDIVQGTSTAFERGILDFPFSVNKHNMGRAMIARDIAGAVRFIDPGNLPFSKEIIQYDKERLNERKLKEKKDDLELIIEDLRATMR
jgi:methylaspartate mutase epsilon subunit